MDVQSVCLVDNHWALRGKTLIVASKKNKLPKSSVSVLVIVHHNQSIELLTEKANLFSLQSMNEVA